MPNFVGSAEHVRIAEDLFRHFMAEEVIALSTGGTHECFVEYAEAFPQEFLRFAVGLHEQELAESGRANTVPTDRSPWYYAEQKNRFSAKAKAQKSKSYSRKPSFPTFRNLSTSVSRRAVPLSRDEIPILLRA